MKFSIFGASVQGYSHERANCPNQDAVFGNTYIVRDNNNCIANVSVVALIDVTDYSGSFTESIFQFVVKTAANFVGKNFYLLINNKNDDDIKLHIINHIRNEVKPVIEDLYVGRRFLDLSLLIAASDGIDFIALSVGDSVMYHHFIGSPVNTFPTFNTGIYRYGRTSLNILSSYVFLDEICAIHGKMTKCGLIFNAFFLMSNSTAFLLKSIHNSDWFNYTLLNNIGLKTEQELSEYIKRNLEDFRSEKVCNDLSLIAMVDVNYNKE